MLCQNVWHSTRLSYNFQHYGRGLGKVPAGKSSLSGADGIPRELEYKYRGAGAGASHSPAASAPRWWAPGPAVYVPVV